MDVELGARRPPAAEGGPGRLAQIRGRPVEAQVLAAGLIVAACVLALEGLELLAIVCASGAISAFVWAHEWAPVFGSAGYRRRATRVWNDLASAREVTAASLRRIARERVPQLTALEPPERLRESHRELLSLVGERVELSDDDWSEWVGQTESWLERRAELKAELTGVALPAERPLCAAERAYTQAIGQLFETSDREYASAAKDGQLLLHRAIRKLSRMRRPDAVAEEHDVLIAALTDYAAAERDFSAAVLAADGPRFIQSAERLGATRGRLDAWRERTTDAILG